MRTYEAKQIGIISYSMHGAMCTGGSVTVLTDTGHYYPWLVANDAI